VGEPWPHSPHCHHVSFLSLMHTVTTGTTATRRQPANDRSQFGCRAGTRAWPPPSPPARVDRVDGALLTGPGRVGPSTAARLRAIKCTDQKGSPGPQPSDEVADALRDQVGGEGFADGRGVGGRNGQVSARGTHIPTTRRCRGRGQVGQFTPARHAGTPRDVCGKFYDVRDIPGNPE